MPNPLVSVVIPVFNAEKTIASVIQSLLGQTFNPIEIIVVDDGSLDTSASIVQSFSDVRYMYQANAGPATARNYGARESKGEVVFFTDSDCIPKRDWIETAMKTFANPSVMVVAGSYGIANPNNRLARCIQNEIAFRHACLMPSEVKALGSYNFAIRRKVFDTVGGFNEAYRYASGEDNDLSYKIIKSGHAIHFNKAVLVDHYHTQKIVKYLKEQFRHGVWRVKMYKDHPRMMAGDNYTFWKDALEVPAAYLIAGLLFLFVVAPDFFGFFLMPAVILLWVLEFVFSLKINKNFTDALFFSFVMFLRAFARSFGFIHGFFKFIIKII